MPSIRDFSGGVVNQGLLGKDGGAGIIIDANNVLSSWNGELRKRTGSRIVTQLDQKSRIIPYRLPNNDDALLVFTDKKVDGYKMTDAGLVPIKKAEVVGIVYPLTGWPKYDPATANGTGNYQKNGSWRVSSNLYEGGDDQFTGVVAPRLFQKSTPRYLQFYNETAFSLESVSLHYDMYYRRHNTEARYTQPVFYYSDDGQKWMQAATEYTDNLRFTDSHHAVSDIAARLNTYYGDHKYWRVQFMHRAGDWEGGDAYVNLSVKEVNTSISASGNLSFPTEYAEDVLQNIKFAQSGNNIFFACSGSAPTELHFANSVYALETIDPIVRVENPGSSQVNKKMLEEYGSPAAVACFQNRLVFSGFEKAGNKVIFSKFGDFGDFTVRETDVKSTDPINVNSVQLRAPIENLWAGNDTLYALSSDGVSMLDAAGGVIATDQINFTLRNRESADGMTPTVKDDIMIYLGNDRRKIYITDYDFVVQRFKAKDLSIGYNDFLTSGIVAMYYASRKCSLIYGYKDDGNIITLLFDADLQKNALFPCDMAGDIKDMQVFKSGDKFRVLMVAQTNDRWYLIEKNEQPDYVIMDFMSEDSKREYSKTVVQDGLYLDYMTHRYYNTPTSIIADVPYGADTTVAVFADGNYVGEKICSQTPVYYWTDAKDAGVFTLKARPVAGDVVYKAFDAPVDTVVSFDGTTLITSGKYSSKEWVRASSRDTTYDCIVLDSPASDFVLGYNYDAYAVLKLATPYTSKKYPKEVATYLINTGYLEIGNSFDNLQPILNNMRDKLDLFDKPMLLNGEYTKTMDKMDNSPYIILRSNEPMPFMITGIDFKVDYSNYQGGI